jgi:hypothetical protein
MIRGPGWEFSQDTGEPPTLCNKCHGIFNDHSELGLMSHPKVKLELC